MAANIVHPEVAFPYGEDIIIISNRVTCTIHPILDGHSNPTEEGEIHITLPYKEATIETSTRPKERLFSVCNKSTEEIFKITGECFAKFIIDHRKSSTSDPELADKQLHIVLTGNGPKKNSAS